MDREQEERYIDLAADNPELLCSEVPDEILEACAAEAEPTAFMEEFLATGHSQWILLKYRRRLPQAMNPATVAAGLPPAHQQADGGAGPDWASRFSRWRIWDRKVELSVGVRDQELLSAVI